MVQGTAGPNFQTMAYHDAPNTQRLKNTLEKACTSFSIFE